MNPRIHTHTITGDKVHREIHTFGGEHRRHEVRVFTLVAVVVCGLAAAGRIVPVIDAVMSGVVSTAVVAVVAVVVLRWVARRVRWHLEDRAAVRAAAAWRAEHPRPVVSDRAGVA